MARKSRTQKRTLRRRNSKSKSRKNTKTTTRRARKQRGGLKLAKPNMDCNGPFHPTWDSRNSTQRSLSAEGHNSYRFLQEAGRRRRRSGRRSRR